jgi:hypothetical protein
MLLNWHVRYLDTRDKQFKGRNLWLETDALDPAAKAAVEATHELKDTGRGREMLRFRHLFRGDDPTSGNRSALCDLQGRMSYFNIPDYFEDETGKELTHQQMAVALSGSPHAVLIPPGARQHDIDYMLAPRPSILIDQVTLSQVQLNILGYFARDLRELLASAFYKDGPGTLTGLGGKGSWVLKTAVTDEEIRSSVMIFRLLYMENERANFVKAVAVFHQALLSHPLARWVKGIAGEYEKELEEEPDCIPLVALGRLSFSRKRLIDVFLYTRYAHQPLGKNEQRAKQFQDCLAAVGGNQDVLTMLFLTEVWRCALHYRSAGIVIADFYDRYCRFHKVAGGVLASLRSDHPGLGTLEKQEAREARIFREKAVELAKAIWEREGRPDGGYTQFLNPAIEQLQAAMGRTSGSRGSPGTALQGDPAAEW